MNRAQIELLHWVKENDPFIFNLAKERYKLQTQGMGTVAPTDTKSGFFSSFIDTVKNIVPAVIGYKQQKKIMDLQIERARTGQPPLDASAYAPVMRVEAAVSPEGEASARRIAIDTVRSGIGDMKPYLIGGLGLLAVFLLTKKRR